MRRMGDIPIRADTLPAEAVAAELDRRRVTLSAPPVITEASDPVLIWTLGGESHATPLADIWEVMPPLPITHVPGAIAGLIGIFARRGIVHNLFDPSPALGRPPLPRGDGYEAGTGYRILVLRHDRPRLALRVDTAAGIALVPRAAPGNEGDALSRVATAGSGERFALIDTPQLIGRLIARHSPQEG